MSESNENENTQPVAAVSQAAEPDPSSADVRVPRTRFRDRAFSLWSLVSVGAAGLVLGGVVGGGTGLAVGAWLGHQGSGDHPGRHFGPGGPGMRPGPDGNRPGRDPRDSVQPQAPAQQEPSTPAVPDPSESAAP